MEVVLIQKVRRMIGNCHIYVGQTTLRFERGYFFQSRFDIAVRVVFNDFHKNQLAASPALFKEPAFLIALVICNCWL